MADSNITKKALAMALKELMEGEDFSKISVSDICNKCNMNRKSFYYHFKDKYDLVNWIFDVEFFQVVEENGHNDAWPFLERLCTYLYDNKKFYRCALKIKGQNSFEEHFIELLTPIIETDVRMILMSENREIDEHVMEFHTNFCLDAFVGVIKRWVLDKKSMEAEEFLILLKSCIYMIAEGSKKNR